MRQDVDQRVVAACGVYTFRSVGSIKPEPCVAMRFCRLKNGSSGSSCRCAGGSLSIVSITAGASQASSADKGAARDLKFANGRCAAALTAAWTHCALFLAIRRRHFRL